MNDEVSKYIEKQQPWQIGICESLRKVIFNSVPAVEEKLQYGKPHYLKNGKYAAVISVAKDKVSFVIFNALEIQEIKGFLESTTSPERKTATIKQGQDVDYAFLAKLLAEASAAL